MATPDIYMYPLPIVEDLFATLSGGDTFTKLDLAYACQQLMLDKDSGKLAIMNTTKGLFGYNRLPLGVSAAPAFFSALRKISSKVYHIFVFTLCCKDGLHAWKWRSSSHTLHMYVCRQAELSLENGCVLWGSQVVVHPPACAQVFDMLYSTHPGILK